MKLSQKAKTLATLLAIVPGMMYGADDLLTVAQQAVNQDPSYQSTLQSNNSVITAVEISRASLLPQVSASAGKSWYGSKQTTYGVDSWSKSKTNTYGLSVSQSLFNYSYYKNLAASRASAAAAELNNQVTYQNLLTTVSEAYFNLANAQAEVAIYKEQVKIQEDLVKLAKTRYQAGTALYSDVLTAKASLLSTKRTVIDAEKSVVTYQNSLSSHLDNPVSSVNEIKGILQLNKLDASKLSLWIKKGLSTNPNILEERLHVLAARKTLESKKAAILPTLSAEYDYSKSDAYHTGEAYTTLHSTDSQSNTLSLSLNIPLYSGGATHAAIQQYRYQLLSAQDTYNAEKKSIESSINTDFRSLVLQEKTIRSTKSSVLLDRKSYKAILAAYRAGKETMTDVQSALSVWYSEKLSLASAQYTFLIDYITFKKDVGVLTLQDIQTISDRMSGHVRN